MDNPLQSSLKPKSFWEKPEGTLGMVVAIAAGILGVYGLSQIMPWLVNFMDSLLHVTLVGITLAAILWVLFDKRFQTLVWYGYQSIMRAITGLFITVDPIGIVKNYVKSMKANLEKMQEQIGNVKGQMQNLKRNIGQNSKQIDQCMELAAQAKKQGKNNDMQLQARQAQRLTDSNQNLGDLYTKLEMIARTLDKMADVADVVIKDTENEVDIREKEFVAISASTNAMRSAMSVINGDPDKRAIFDMTMESLGDRIAMQVGEMENFMDFSKNIMSKVDLQNGVLEEDGLKMLDAWEKKADSGVLLSPADKKKVLIAAKDPSDVLDVESVVATKTSKYKAALTAKK